MGNKPLLIENGAKERQVEGRKQMLRKTSLFHTEWGQRIRGKEQKVAPMSNKIFSALMSQPEFNNSQLHQFQLKLGQYSA